MNLIQIAIESGFKADIHDFNYKDNWFGVSTYHPDVTLKLGTSEIQLSLGGIEAGMDKDCLQSKFLHKEKYGTFLLTAKRIALYKNNELFYKSCAGIMPDEQTIINFFNQ